MKHLANESREIRRLKACLELPETPRAIDERLRQIYAELPEELPEKRKGFGARRAAAVALAAVLALSLTVGAAAAGGFTAIGAFIEGLNRQDDFQAITVTHYAQGGNVGTYDTAEIAQTAGENGYSMELTQAYSDGERVVFAAALTVPEEVDATANYLFPKNVAVTVNGEAADAGKQGLILWPTGKACEYSGVVSAKLAQPVEGGTALAVEVELSDFHAFWKNYQGGDDFPQVAGSPTLRYSFDVTADASHNGSFDFGGVENGKFKLLGGEFTPSETRLSLEAAEGSYAYAQLLLPDGRRIPWNNRLDTWDTAEDGESTVVLHFDGLPAGTEQVVLRLVSSAIGNYWQDPGAEDFGHDNNVDSVDELPQWVLAEYTVDVESGAARASQLWNDPESLLAQGGPYDYYNLDSFWDYDPASWVWENGLCVSGMYFQDGKFRVRVLTEGEYREIKAEIFTAEGEKVAETVSVYQYSGGYENAFYDEHTNPDWDSYRERTGKEPQRHYDLHLLSENYLPAYGETLTVRITDNQSGEELIFADCLMNVRNFY